MLDQFMHAILQDLTLSGGRHQCGNAAMMQMFPLHRTPFGVMDFFAGATVLCFLVGMLFFFFFLFWLFTIIDLMRSDFIVPTNKITWLILLLFFPPLGVLLYWIIGSKQKIESPGPRDDVDRFYRGRRND